MGDGIDKIYAATGNYGTINWQEACCTTNTLPLCFQTSVPECVCAYDAYCCDVNWDESCTTNVNKFGCGNCLSASTLGTSGGSLSVLGWSPESDATDDDYIFAEWTACTKGVYEVFANMAAAAPTNGINGYVILAYGSTSNKFPTSCDYMWSNYNPSTQKLYSRFEAYLEANQTLYLSFRAASVVSKFTTFSISIIQELNGRSNVPSRTFIADPLANSCYYSGKLKLPMYPGFGTLEGSVPYGKSVSFNIDVCSFQLPPGVNITVYAQVIGQPGAAAFQTYLFYGNDKLLNYDSDKKFVSHVQYTFANRDEFPKDLSINVTGWGTFIELFQY